MFEKCTPTDLAIILGNPDGTLIDSEERLVGISSAAFFKKTLWLSTEPVHSCGEVERMKSCDVLCEENC